MPASIPAHQLDVPKSHATVVLLINGADALTLNRYCYTALNLIGKQSLGRPFNLFTPEEAVYMYNTKPLLTSDSTDSLIGT
jgi:hypothetical protein